MSHNFPLDIDRLQKSDTWHLCKTRPELTRPFINLWAAALFSKPAGRLRNEDSDLRKAADLSMEQWRTLKAALLHGFVDDGEWLVHPVIVEIAAKRPKRSCPGRKTDEYSADFEAWWSIWLKHSALSGASKLEAAKEWARNEPPRPPDQVLNQATATYLAEQRKRREPKFCHPRTFLSQARWEGYIQAIVETTKSHIESAEKAKTAWNGKGVKLAEMLGADQFVTWFAGAKLHTQNGKISSIEFPTPFKADYVRRHFLKQVHSAFGEIDLKATQ
jgi:hypothetical protein